MRLILASKSPRRKTLLASLGIPFDIVAPSFKEVLTPHLSPERQVVAFASGKARSIGISDAFVLGGDTLISIDHLLLGKPVDIADARRMLTLLQGRIHRVITGVALIIPKGREKIWHEVTEVRMRAMSDEQIDTYIAGKEPLDKAGAYAIQGEGRQFIQQVHGDIDNVVGLPLRSVAMALWRHGFPVPESYLV